jgi:hypothetical protein
MEKSIKKIQYGRKKGSEEEELVSFRLDSLDSKDFLRLKCGIERYAIEYCSNKNAIVIGDVIGTLYVWNALNFKKVFQTSAFDFGINNIKYSSEGDSVIVASIGFRIYTLLPSGRLKLKKTIQTTRTFSLCIIPNTRLLLTSDIIGNVNIWNMNNYSLRSRLNTNNKKLKGYAILYLEHYDLLICGFECGKIALYNVKENFAELSQITAAKEGWQMTLGYDKKLNLLLVSTDTFVIKTWRIAEGKYLQYWTQFPTMLAEVYEFIPAIIDKEECAIVTGRSCQIVILGLEHYRQDLVLKRKYSSAKILKHQKKILLGSNISNKIDIATFE